MLQKKRIPEEKFLDIILNNKISDDEKIYQLYLLVLPDYDMIKEVKRWPAISKKLWEIICNNLERFESKMLWVNIGFTTHNVPDNELVLIDTGGLIY